MSQLIRFITLSYVIHNTNPSGIDVNNIDESHVVYDGLLVLSYNQIKRNACIL